MLKEKVRHKSNIVRGKIFEKYTHIDILYERNKKNDYDDFIWTHNAVVSILNGKRHK